MVRMPSPSGLSQEQLVDGVRRVAASVLGDAASDLPVEWFAGEAAVRLPPTDVARLMAALRDDPELAFEMLMDVTCVQFPKRALPLGEFDVVYHLTSLSRCHRIRLKVACADPDDGVDSVVGVWPGANYMEREARDMFGVTFRDHPDPRRILMSDDYRGWPLRKDFPYRGH